MCYRFYVPERLQEHGLEELMAYLQTRNVGVKTGDIQPGDVAAVIASNRQLRPQPFGMHWGYHLPDGKLVYNARSETAAQKAMFSDGMRQRRCLIPAAHYYEWQKSPRGRMQYAIRPRGCSLMLLAGVYRFEGSLPVFSILTRVPAPEIAQIHDRMPVILPREAVSDWLNPKYPGDEILRAAVTDMEFKPWESGPLFQAAPFVEG